MPRKSNSYGPGIQRRYNGFYVVHEIPKDIRHKFLSETGKPRARFIMSLQTDDLKKARREAPGILAEWKSQIAEVRGTPDDAARIRHNLQRARFKGDAQAVAEIMADVSMMHGDMASPSISTYAGDTRDLTAYLQEAEEAAVAVADDFAARATGLKTPLTDHLDEWLAQKGVAPRTQAMMKADVERFAYGSPNVQDVTPRQANIYIAVLRKRVSDATIKKTLNSLRGYWKYLQDIEVAPEALHPFDKENLKALRMGRNGNGKGELLPFDPADVTRLIEASDGTLRDLITLAAYTGCRIEELCAMKVADVKADHFKVVAGKTEDAIRDVPIHPALQQTVARLLDQSKDGYLLSGLKVNAAGQRSNTVGKRFGTLKTKLGFGERHNFHSLRRTVATILERAKVQEVVTSRILGHRLKTMSYGVYSGGLTVAEMAEDLAKVKYPQ